MKIEAYSFGKIVIDGKSYDTDVILFPDKVRSHWRRIEGHSLMLEDLKDIIDYKPEILIVGTGAYGVLKIHTAIKEALKKIHIELIAEPTGIACDIYNRYLEKKERKRVIGAFHLTC